MVVNPGIIDIFSLYDSNLVNLYSINEIAKRLGKAYPYVNQLMNRLIDKGIFRRSIIGRSHLCSIDFSSDEAIALLSLHEIRKKRQGDYAEIERYIWEKSHITFHFALFSGSHVLFVIEDLKDRLEIQRTHPSSLVLTRQEFVNYLVETETIWKSHTVIYGFERFFETVRRNIEPLQKRHSPLRCLL
jgi:DNA-binding Lrp family transcriptional regulator